MIMQDYLKLLLEKIDMPKEYFSIFDGGNLEIRKKKETNKTTKKKYYKLLIDSFSKGKDKTYKNEINNIQKLYPKAESNNFKDIDDYISTISD